MSEELRSEDDQVLDYERQYECSCGHTWTARVTLAANTTNLSGEKTQWCPKCGKKPLVAREAKKVAPELRLAVPPETVLYTMRGVDTRPEAKFVEAMTVRWAETCKAKSRLRMELDDILRFRTALVEDNAVLEKVADDKLKAVIEKSGIEQIAQEVVETIDGVIDRLGQASISQFVAGAIIEAGQMLLAMHELTCSIKEQKLPFKVNLAMEDATKQYAEKIGGACASDAAGLDFLAWLRIESDAVAAMDERIGATRAVLTTVKAMREIAQMAGIDDATMREELKKHGHEHNCAECESYEFCDLPVKKSKAEMSAPEDAPTTEDEAKPNIQDVRKRQGGAFEAQSLFDPRLLGGGGEPIH